MKKIELLLPVGNADCLGKGMKYHYFELTKDVGKFIRICWKILVGDGFEDVKIRKGYAAYRARR